MVRDDEERFVRADAQSNGRDRAVFRDDARASPDRDRPDPGLFGVGEVYDSLAGYGDVDRISAGSQDLDLAVGPIGRHSVARALDGIETAIRVEHEAPRSAGVLFE